MKILTRVCALAFAAAITAALTLSGSAHAEKRVAFVVGIREYPNLATKTDPLNGQLRTPVNDAETMATTLVSLGFDVTSAENVGYAEFLTKFEAFKRRIEPGDTVFFYYAGHGVALHGANYLLPRDVPAIDPDSEQLLRRQSIAEADIITDIQDRGAKITIVVLDSCRDNPIEEFAKKQALLTGRPFTRGVGMLSRGLALGPTVSGVFSIYSAGFGEQALDGLGRTDQSDNSVFTRVFATKLKQPGLSLVDLFYDVQDEVSTLAQSVKDDDGRPHKQTPAIYSETRGGRTIYLGGLPARPMSDGGRTAAAPTAQDEIFWLTIKDSSTQALFDEFLTKFPASSRAAEARARLEELNKGKVAVVAPPVVPAVPSTPCGDAGAVTVSLSRTAAPLSAAEECALKSKDTFKECEKCPELVVVPAGSFTMGSPATEVGRLDNEGPQHLVTFKRQFAVGKFAVTFDEWDACVADGGCNGYRPGDRGWHRGRQPAINVSWNDAKSYAAWLSKKTAKTYRLLSESEREYAARAATTTPFWWGSSISTKQANYDGSYAYGSGAKGEYRGKTMPVDAFAPNPWGLYQVHGNAYDWVEDCYHDNYMGASSDGSAWISGDCNIRVLRGGSWDYYPQYLRSAHRAGLNPDVRGILYGFRVARTLLTP